MTLETILLAHIRESSRALWRGVRRRLGIRLILLMLLVHLGFFGILWLLGDAWQTSRQRDAALAVARVLLPGAGILAALAVALLDTLRALIVSGPVLRSLGDGLLAGAAGPGASPILADQFAGFGSAHGLARVAHMADLPLLLFLAHIVFRVDVKSLLQAAQTGLGREGLVRELERQARDRAALVLRRLRALVWLSLSLALVLPFLVGWLLR